MNFFGSEKEMLNYFKDNDLDYDTTFGLELNQAFIVGKKIFEIGDD